MSIDPRFMEQLSATLAKLFRNQDLEGLMLTLTATSSMRFGSAKGCRHSGRS